MEEAPPHLIPGGLVCGHMPLQLSAVGERVVAQGAGKVLLVLLMAVLDVLLERSQTLVAPVAVGAGQQLGEGIWRSRWQVCKRDSRGGEAGQKVRGSMAANGQRAHSAICSKDSIRSELAQGIYELSDCLAPPHHQGAPKSKYIELQTKRICSF